MTKTKMKSKIPPKTIPVRLTMSDIVKLKVLAESYIAQIDKLLIDCEKHNEINDRYYNTLVEMSEDYKKLSEKLKIGDFN